MTKEQAWIPTRGGKRFYPLAPSIADIDIYDIAHALSNVCRYVGHTRFHYSVAQHSVYVSQMVPPELALTGLLHDASEAYLSDISRDVKMLMYEYKGWESNLEEAIARRFGLPFPLPYTVKQADTEILRREGAWLFPEGSPMWQSWGVTRKEDYPEITYWKQSEAAETFLWMFHRYTTEVR